MLEFLYLQLLAEIGGKNLLLDEWPGCGSSRATTDSARIQPVNKRERQKDSANLILRLQMVCPVPPKWQLITQESCKSISVARLRLLQNSIRAAEPPDLEQTL